MVNIAMMLKSEALMSLITGGSLDEFAKKALEYLEAKHGTAAGHFNGDENLSGLSPVNGTELCGVVEAMYSYEWLFAITGDTDGNEAHLFGLEPNFGCCTVNFGQGWPKFVLLPTDLLKFIRRQDSASHHIRRRVVPEFYA